jgi:gamma-tubulin complex component 2
MADASIVRFGTKVALRNKWDGHFLFVQVDGRVSARGEHPSLNYVGRERREELLLVDALNKDSTEIVQFGQSICLLTRDEMALAVNASCEVRAEAIEGKASSKLACWTILDVNSTVRRPVTCYDEVVLKTPFGVLGVDSNEVVSVRGKEGTLNSSWRIMKAGVPAMPQWVFTRPHLDHNDLVLSRDSALESAFRQKKLQRRGLSDDAKQLGALPDTAQEQALLEDILFCLCSIEGTYIRRVPHSEGNIRRFTYEVEPFLETPSCNESLLYFVQKILPLCTQHDRINIFISVHSHFEFGLVSQALCASIGTLLKEYRLRVAQLEHEFSVGHLTMQKLWFYLQPCLRTLEALHRLAFESEGLKGGALLNVVYRSLASASDDSRKQLFSYMFEKALVPYTRMLSKWVHEGTVEDPYDEFFVQEHKEFSKDSVAQDFNNTYWMLRFVVRDDQVPLFLNKQVQKVLMTGKYLNVIRECGRSVNCPLLGGLDNADFAESIEKAYEWAAAELNRLVIEEEQLVGRLRSIKHYFFIDQGDFFVHLMDSAQDELEKHEREVSKEKLESLLDLTLRTSSTNADPFKEDLSCELHPYTLQEQLFAKQNISGASPSGEQLYLNIAPNYKGLEKFVLDYSVKWPLSLVVSRNALTNYQLVFRHLFFCKYVERQLCQAWLLHQSTKELELQATFIGAYALLQRMLHFVKNYVYYMTVEVLEPQWHRFLGQLSRLQTIDGIMEAHTVFLDRCLKECLLMDQALYNTLNTAICNCLNFAKVIQTHAKSMRFDQPLLLTSYSATSSLERRKLRIQEETSATQKVLARDQYALTIEQYTSRFDALLRKFLSQVQNTRETHLVNLVIRLDFNGYYSDKLQAAL